MPTKELKLDLIENIEDLKDETVLNILKTVLDTYKSEPLMISEKRMKIPDEAKKQLENNDYVTDEELNKDEENWLKE